MTRSLWLLPMALAWACDKPAPSPAPLPTTPPASASAPKPVASASSAPVTSASAAAPGPSASAAATVDAGSPFACTFDLPAPTASLAKIPGAVLAHAIIPSLDAHMKAKLTPWNTMDWVTSCNGVKSSSVWNGPDWNPDPSIAPGTVRFLGTKALPEGREAVWLATARDGGNCISADGYGYLAIVALSDDKTQLDVLGVGEWHAGCGPKRSLRPEKLGDETVYVQTDSAASHEGASDFEHVWTLKTGKLVDAGQYNLVVEPSVQGSTDLDDAGLSLPFIKAKARFVGSEIVVKGESSWQKSGDGGSFVVAKTGPYLRTYEIVDGKLVEKKAPTKKR